MDHDAAHKYIYSLPETMADLLRLVVPGWVDELDIATLQDRSSEFLDAAHRKRSADMVWRASFRRGRLGGGVWPRVLVLVEFQSKVDGRMAERVREYSEMLLGRMARSDAPAAGRPWLLPVVVYNGAEPWTAAGREADMAPLPSKGIAHDLALLQPQAYRLLSAGGPLTSGAPPAEDWPLENRVSATVRLQRAETGRLGRQLREESRRFPGGANRAFRRALHAWARALWADKTKGAPGFPAFEEFERTGAEAMPTIAEANWDRWEAGLRAEGKEQGIRQGVQQGIRQGVQQGRVEGEARVVKRLAALKFGPGTAERLSSLVDGLKAREALDQVGDWIIECESGDELLSRVSALQAKGGNGD